MEKTMSPGIEQKWLHDRKACCRLETAGACHDTCFSLPLITVMMALLYAIGSFVSPQLDNSSKAADIG